MKADSTPASLPAPTPGDARPQPGARAGWNTRLPSFMLRAFRRFRACLGLPARGRTQAGLSLFELVAVLAVVAAVAAVAVSSRSTPNADAFADGETLRGALRATRTRAMADIVPWSFTVAGQTGTYTRDGVTKGTVSFATTGVAAGTATFDTRGQPSGTLSFTVAGYSRSPVAITAGTGYVP